MASSWIKNLLKHFSELPSGSNVLINGELQRTVKCEESMWSLEPGKCVQINLEKTEERFWTAVCKGDPEIDRTKVDSTRNIDDFDEQTQTDFQQVMYDHQQKLMGKPTSKEKVIRGIISLAALPLGSLILRGATYGDTQWDNSIQFYSYTYIYIQENY